MRRVAMYEPGLAILVENESRHGIEDHLQLRPLMFDGVEQTCAFRFGLFAFGDETFASVPADKVEAV